MPEEVKADEAAPEPGTEAIVINGTPVIMPREVEAAGRAAIHRWHTEQDHPHAVKLAKDHGVDLTKVPATGHGKKHLVSDVQLHLKAEAEKKVAESAAEKAKPTAAPKEG